jgi:5-methyltetrahydropteroyltriglutamate--homocysteine methyltransferase
LNTIKQSKRPEQVIFLGVTNVLDSRIETPEEIRDVILEAAEIIPADQLGSTDDCGFSPFADDDSTSRDIAFAKIKARVEGTKLAEQVMSQKKHFFHS